MKTKESHNGIQAKRGTDAHGNAVVTLATPLFDVPAGLLRILNRDL